MTLKEQAYWHERRVRQIEIGGAFDACNFDSAEAETAFHTGAALSIRAAIAALTPFAEACAKADAAAEMQARCGFGVMTDEATPGWGVRYGHVKAARAIIAPEAATKP